MNFDQLTELILARKFAVLIQTFKEHVLEFMAQLVCDQPTTFCVSVQSSETKYVVIAMAYSDDKELMDQVVTEIDALLTKKFTERYPQLLEHVGEDHRGEER